MKSREFSFRNKIFISLMLVTLLFLSAMATIEYYQDSQNFKDRSKNEILKSESGIQESFAYSLDKESDSLRPFFEKKTFELANVFNTNINIYDLDGSLISSNLKQNGILSHKIMNELKSKNSEILKDSLLKENKFRLFNTYNYISKNGTPIAILNVQHIFDNTSSKFQIGELIKQFMLIIIFLMVLSGFVSWYISRGLTKKIAEIAQKLLNTKISENEPINYVDNDEIKPLVNSYNDMLEKIDEQTHLLQKNERAEAWKEMARQVAHEINNPLTPLKLTVQNFYRRYSAKDDDNEEKVRNLTKSIIHQIDIISSITQSFSDFAKMPINVDTEIDVVDTIRKTMSIFPQAEVNFATNTESLIFNIDNLYLTRIVTNIIKNGIQAIPESREKKINVNLTDEKDKFLISITDNGKGISEENKNKVFEQNFTTKSTGMGLGLSMVKKIVEDYKGKIWFETQEDVGTTFFIEFYKN